MGEMCSWEFARLGLCGNASIHSVYQGPLTVTHIFLIGVLLIFPLIAAYQTGYVVGLRKSRLWGKGKSHLQGKGENDKHS